MISGCPDFTYPPTDYDEPYRGQFHFSPPAGWMNDPNGLLHHDGIYHFFYQHNPHGLDHGDAIHWGHATSSDLIHWTHRPIALAPEIHPGDLWSGHGVVDTDNTSGLQTGTESPIVVFAGTDGVIAYYSNDGAETFTAYDGGRKLVEIPGPSRDPKVLWHADSARWSMVVWSCDDGGNGVNIYSSPDLLQWDLESRFAAPWLYECPDLFALPVDGSARVRWVLTDASSRYLIGDFDGKGFVPDGTEPKSMDLGRTSPDGTFYAAQTFNHMPDGRTVQMGWQPGNHGATWTGNASFPAELGLRTFPDGPRVTRRPIREIEILRGESLSWADVVVTADPAGNPLAGLSWDTFELTACVDTETATATRCGFRLHVRADGSCDRAVTYDLDAHTLDGAPLTPSDGRVQMQILVDRGQVEIFADEGGFSVSDNVDFDPSAAARGVAAFAEGGTVRLSSLQVTRLRSAWACGPGG